MAVTVSGMFGNGKTYFADSPVVIDISGLEWGNPVTSPFTVVRVDVLYNGNVVGDFRADTDGQTEISFDISSALRAIWSDFQYEKEVEAANNAAQSAGEGDFSPAPGYDFDNAGIRTYRSYSIVIYTEYLDSTDGEFTTTSSGEITGGRCAIGGYTEWERSIIGSKENADISYREHSNARNGDASTKPTSSPERVGRDSITSWVDVQNAGTTQVYYPKNAGEGRGYDDSTSPHAPLVVRDNQLCVDFLFINRRGAIETCSGLTKEAMDINVDVMQYGRIDRPSFNPSRSLMAVGTDGRRSWQMSSGHVTREWAEWWSMEFLGGKRKRHWMLYRGKYVPVVIEPAKKSINIYDLTKQQMPHVDFSVTLALEG